MPHLSRSRRPQRPLPALLAGFAGLLLFLGACQDPAGTPPTLEAGVVSFSYSGRIAGSFIADGRCYWSQGYPLADSACALAVVRGDTLRIRGERNSRLVNWQHMNLEFPTDGSCADPARCRFALDWLSAIGKVERSFRSTAAQVTILEQTQDRIRGTFSAQAMEVGADPADTVMVFDGTFDVPVER